MSSSLIENSNFQQENRYWFEKTWVIYTLTAAIALVVGASMVLPNGSQPPALVILLLSIPICFIKYKWVQKHDKLWLFMFVLPLFVSFPLFIKSDTGEALAAPARYIAAALAFLALIHFPINRMLIFRAASIGAILTLAINFEQLQLSTRIDWGAGHLQAAYIGVVIMSLSIAQMSLDKKIAWRLVGLLGALCALVMVIKTGTRGAWPAIILVLFIQLILFPGTTKRRILNLIICLMLAVSAVKLFPVIEKRYQESVVEIQGYFNNKLHVTSFGVRLDYWFVAIDAIKENPIFGVSFYRRSELLDEYVVKNPASAGIGNDGRHSSHNEILNIMSTRGLFGLGALMLLYLVPLIFFIKHSNSKDNRFCRYAGVAGISSVVTMMVCGITEAPLMNVRVSTFYGFLMVFLYHVINQNCNKKAIKAFEP